MDVILQATFSESCLCMQIILFWLEFHRNNQQYASIDSANDLVPYNYNSF